MEFLFTYGFTKTPSLLFTILFIALKVMFGEGNISPCELTKDTKTTASHA
jgi:hypothetical protein